MAQEVVLNEIKNIQAKSKQMRKLSEILHDDFMEYVEEAEKKQEISLISKASAMQRKSDDNKEEFKQLEESLGFFTEEIEVNEITIC